MTIVSLPFGGPTSLRAVCVSNGPQGRGPSRGILAATLALLALIPAHAARPPTEWRDYGGRPDQSKFIDSPDLTRENVAQLQVAWTYPTGDERSYLFNPVVVDGVMYVLAKNNSLVALDVATGKEIWIHAHLRGVVARGINYWESADRSDRRLLFMMDNTLQAIDARTGESILTFGRDGIVDLREGLGRDPATLFRVTPTTPGRVFENLLLIGSSTGESYLSAPGHIRAFDVITGKLAWTFHTIPQPGEFGYDTWPRDAHKYMGGVNVWGEITVDAARGIAFFPLGSPTYDYYGADRHGANLYGNCLLALDARTGKRLWHYQTVHHDLWDYDLVSAPQLIAVNHGGKRIDAVAVATKQGFLFAFDRVSGEPLWPIEERPVPASDVPGEQAWPTQPVPTVLPPFSRQTMTEQDVTSLFLTPEERATWVERVAKARKGLFTPPGLTETISVPGAVGGTNWGNSAANPEAGLVYLLNQDFPSFYRLELRPPERNSGRAGESNEATVARGRTVYQNSCQVCHGEDRAGTTIAPPLLTTASFFSYPQLRRTVIYGVGRMPAIPHVDDDAISDLLSFLNHNAPARPGVAGESAEKLPPGPVVASGGAPRGNLAPPRRFLRGGQPYPEGIEVPADRYYTDYGLGHPHIMTPPWSTIIAYDLNQGVIKWKRPLGQDQLATAAGATGTGVPRGAQRNGMIVTSTGLVFSTAKDGHLYAFDADTGDVLWSGKLPMGTEGLPAAYEHNGKHFIVVAATTPLTWGPKSREGGIGSTAPRGVGGYVVFALPDKKP